MEAAPAIKYLRIGPEGQDADLAIPSSPKGLVLFIHGSGSGRSSPRNQAVATALNRHRIATLLFDLLTKAEARDTRNVFDIELLASRTALMLQRVGWIEETSKMPVGLFGASTGAAAALLVAAEHPKQVQAVVSRGGRPDLASSSLFLVKAPTLLIVGAEDRDVLSMNKEAMKQLSCPKLLEVVPGASHLFEEPGTLDRVAELAASWFDRQFSMTRPP